MSNHPGTQGQERQLSEMTSQSDEDETNVRQLRQELGLSVEEFAAKVSVHPRTVLRWELGESTPRGTAKRFCLPLANCKSSLPGFKLIQ